MSETVDIIKIAIAGVAIGIVALVIAGFYFTITNASGQGFLVGQFELFSESVFNAIESPFIAIYKFITGIPAKLGFMVLIKIGRIIGQP